MTDEATIQTLRVEPGDFVLVRIPVGSNPHEYLSKVAHLFPKGAHVIVLTREVEIEKLSDTKLATLGLQRAVEL